MEMYILEDYTKSIWLLGLMEIFIYTITGALIYTFIGLEVHSPALLSSSFTVSHVIFSISLPVIFISSLINFVVLLC